MASNRSEKGGASASGRLTYAAAVDHLYRAQRFGVNPSLAGIRALAEAMGRPQDAMRVVQVTGTNGKSSVTRTTAAVLHAHGARVGSYTSPHLVEYTERMEIDGSVVSRDDFARAIDATVGAAARIPRTPTDALGLSDDDEPGEWDAAPGSESETGPALGAFTEFELLTAAALWLFRDKGVDWACLEVGMGGRWDATSVVHPAVAVVTGVALDHTDRLGGTIAAIAEDKAHVIKPGSAAVLGAASADVGEILSRRASEVGAPLVMVSDAAQEGLGTPELTVENVRFRVVDRPRSLWSGVRFDVRGARAEYGTLELAAPAYQVSNAAVALAAAEAALDRPLDAEPLAVALGGMRYPGRFEVVRTAPPLVLDGGHNPEAASVVGRSIDDAFRDRKPVALIGVLRDKDAEGIVRALAPHVAGFVCTANSSDRSLSALELARIVQGVRGEMPLAEEDPGEALRLAERIAGGAGVVVTGSLYTVGEVKALLARGDGAPTL